MCEHGRTSHHLHLPSHARQHHGHETPRVSPSNYYSLAELREGGETNGVAGDVGRCRSAGWRRLLLAAARHAAEEEHCAGAYGQVADNLHEAMELLDVPCSAAVDD